MISADQMAATHAAAFRHERPWSAPEFADLLAQPGCFVCGGPHCFALARVVLDEAELLTIATDPDFQRQGRARAVMAEWMTEAADRGAACGYLEVASDNTGAMALYEGIGFEICGTRPRYYRRRDGPPADALLMRRALP